MNQINKGLLALLMLSLFLSSGTLFAQSASVSVRTFYVCEVESMEDMGKALDPDSCRRSCSPTNDRVTYEASVNDGRVVEKSWTQGSKSPPNMSLLKGCEIVDDKNWSCTEMEPGTLSSTQSRDDHVVTIINIDTKDLKMASLYCMVP